VLIYFCVHWAKIKADTCDVINSAWFRRSCIYYVKHLNNTIKHNFHYSHPNFNVEFGLSNRFIQQDDAAVARCGPEITAAISLRYDPSVCGSTRKLARSSGKLRRTGAVHRRRLHNCGGFADMRSDVLLVAATGHWSPR